MKHIISFPFRIAPRQPWIYLSLWIIWFYILWHFSSQPGDGKSQPIPHFDKVLHFTYFAGGAVVFSGLLLNTKKIFKNRDLILLTLLVGACIGAMDEHRQSLVEGRFGHDVWDWTADCIGSLAGAVVMTWGLRKWRAS